MSKKAKRLSHLLGEHDWLVTAYPALGYQNGYVSLIIKNNECGVVREESIKAEEFTQEMSLLFPSALAMHTSFLNVVAECLKAEK